MRHNTWGYKMEKMRTRLGYNVYPMKRWLRLLQHSRLSSSYPLPMFMLTPGGIDHNRASAKLESYIYRVYMVYAISSCLPHFLLKATMLYVMGRSGHEQFLFYFILFFDFIGILFCFVFSFGRWNGTWHSHMTSHMIWHHKPRTWWKDLEDNVRAHVYNIVALSRK